MLSKSTTRKRMLSKSLCHVQNHAFGLVPANRYFHVFITSNFHSQTLESLCLQASYYDYWLTLDINTTVSTWLDWIFLITTTAHFQPIGSVDTVHSFCLFGRCSQSQYVRLVEQSTINWKLAFSC